jgi:hypothetical protein
MMVQIPDAISGAIRKTQNGAEPYGSSGDPDVLGLLFLALARLGRRQS